MKKYIFKRFNFSKKYKEELINFTKNMCNAEIGGNRFYDGVGNHYMQNPYEITELVFKLKKYQIQKKTKLNNFLEIGYAAGINNSFLNKFFNFKKIVAVDLVDPAGTNTNTFIANLRFKNISLICGDSTNRNTIEKVKALGPYDFIFIDGGHEYETVKKDFSEYSKLLSKNGVIALHDIKSNLCPGVPKFWNELKSKNKKRWFFNEIFNPGQMMECGIGLLIKK